ncbi:hypothetical protein AX16_006746 [Volvariella volvacea WC 439]|nr:hypothetical protein AX16_006746 [Volvariella volvacea WC 439]
MTSSESHLLSPIERCPNEILLKIQEQLHVILDPWKERTKQMLTLRLTSRHLESFFIQFAIRELHYTCHIEWNTENGSNSVLIRNARPISNVGKPFSAPDIFAPFITAINITFFSRWKEHPDYKPQDIVALFSPLWSELKRYTSLTSISIYWPGLCWEREENWVLYPHLAGQVEQVIHQTTAGRLSQFVWSMPLPLHVLMPIGQTLELFCGLEELSLSTAEIRSGAHQLLQSTSLLGDTVLRNPGLRSIGIVHQSPYPFCTLEELFPPQLNNLKCLIIRFGNQLPTTAVNLDQLWHTLKSSGAHLTKLIVDYGISDALMEYLSSYEGLAEGTLNARVPPMKHPGFLSSYTFLEAVQHHASSLAVLKIAPNTEWTLACSYREDMNLDPRIWPMPASFSRLKYLTITPPPDWKSNAENFQSLLNYVSEMPEVQELNIGWYSCNVSNFKRHTKRMAKKVFIRRSKLAIILFTVSHSYMTSLWTIEFPLPPKTDDLGERFQLAKFPFRCIRWDDSSEESL